MSKRLIRYLISGQYFDLESAIPAMGTHAFGFDEVETFDPSYFPLAGPDYKEWASIAFILGYYNG